MATITASQVKELRDKTGAGMMECKTALKETSGDVDAAVELLRVRLGDKALKVGGREATEGTVASYIHSNGKVGVLVEVDCNTDFVARNEDFQAFAREIALHIAASPATQYVSEDEIPQEAKDAELRVFEQQAADKPENIRPKIVEGRVKKWLEEVVLLNQTHVNEDKHESRTIEPSKDDLILAFLERRDELWTRAWLEAEAQRRGSTPAERLLAIFDTFAGWFAQEGFEGCSFINVMLEIDDVSNPVRQATVRHLADIRTFVAGLAEEAGIQDPDGFARQWHILMKGSIVSAAEGDLEAAARAKQLGGLLLAHHGIKV